MENQDSMLSSAYVGPLFTSGSIIGTTNIKDPNTGSWKPLRSLYVKQSTGWQAITAAWIKAKDSTWHQIYPTPTGILSVSPGQLVFNLFNTFSQSETLTITNTGVLPLTLTGYTTSGTAGFQVSGVSGISLPQTLQPNSSAKIQVTVSGYQPTLTSDSLLAYSDDLVDTADINNLGRGSIIFNTNVPILGASTVSVPLIAEVFTDYGNITPSVSSFSTVYFQNATPPTANIVLQNTGNGGNIVIANILSSLGSTIRGTPAIIPAGSSSVISVTIPNGLAPGTYVDRITVNSTAANAPALVIVDNVTVELTYPLIATVPSVLSGSYYQNDAPVSFVVTINNGGQQALTISRITAASGSRISNVPATVPAQSSATFTVTVPSLTAGNYSDIITIFSNAANNIALAIPVSFSVLTVSGSDLFSTAGSYNWTVPPHVHFIDVSTIGGGGGGGGGTARIDRGAFGGGGGGGSSEIRYAQRLQVTPGSVLLVVVGAGGAPGAARDGPYSGGLNGGAGGSSYVVVNSSIPCRSAGGSGGIVAQPGVGYTAPGGGSGTVAATGIGSLLLSGVAGGPGFYLSESSVGGGPGAPGFLSLTGPLGTYGLGGIGSSDPNQARVPTTGTGYGAGGSGGGGNYSDYTLPGQSPVGGSPGLVYISW